METNQQENTEVKNLIKKIEEIRGSRVIVYITGDRPGLSAPIAEDVIRPMYDHLLGIDALERYGERRNNIDLFLYSRGGDVSVPWRIVSMLRQFFGDFNVLIPYKANSAATMISLGADNIVMGRKAELSPIDPTLQRNIRDGNFSSPSEVSVEDVSSYIAFIKERANINDQAALAQLVGMLSNALTPQVLGSVNRQHSHIRLVAKKLLASRKEKIDEEKMDSVIASLTEKMYSHGHAIGRSEAKEIGLPIEDMSADLEGVCWDLFTKYEDDLKIREIFNPETLMHDSEEYVLGDEDRCLAVLESMGKEHRFEVNAVFRKRRAIPQSPHININHNINLPPNIQSEALPESIRLIINQMMESAQKDLQVLVQQEIVRQSPVVGIEAKFFEGCWIEQP